VFETQGLGQKDIVNHTRKSISIIFSPSIWGQDEVNHTERYERPDVGVDRMNDDVAIWEYAVNPDESEGKNVIGGRQRRGGKG
jgi:hypothetical protein